MGMVSPRCFGGGFSVFNEFSNRAQGYIITKPAGGVEEDVAISSDGGSAHSQPTMTKPHDLKTIGLKATLPRLKILSLFENSDVRHLTS